MLVAPRRRFLLPDVEKIAPGFTAAAQGVLVGANAILAGMPGGGKTCAACALAVELTILGKTVDWVCWEELLGLMSAAAGFGEAARETVQGLTRCDSLVIDDFGRSAITTDNKFAGLRELIDARYRAGRQTLITSNIPQSELMRNVGEHLIGRVYENAVVLRFASTSLRMPKCVATL
jgi:DNA replication protein DnaC